MLSRYTPQFDPTQRSFLAWSAKRPQAFLRPYERRPRICFRFPWPLKSTATGLTRTRGRFDCLYALREEHQRLKRIKRMVQMVVPPVDSSRIRIDPAELRR